MLIAYHEKTPKTCVLGVKFILYYDNNNENYSIIVATRPEPTVRPPSRLQGNGI